MREGIKKLHMNEVKQRQDITNKSYLLFKPNKQTRGVLLLMKKPKYQIKN